MAYRGDKTYVVLIMRGRELRRDATDAECLLWKLLRNRQVAGVKFRRQHQFGPYILDFHCAERNVAIEVDGSQHLSDEGIARDIRRSQSLERMGLLVCRFTNVQVLLETEAVVSEIWRVVVRPSP